MKLHQSSKFAGVFFFFIAFQNVCLFSLHSLLTPFFCFFTASWKHFSGINFLFGWHFQNSVLTQRILFGRLMENRGKCYSFTGKFWVKSWGKKESNNIASPLPVFILKWICSEVKTIVLNQHLYFLCGGCIATPEKENFSLELVDTICSMY